MHLYDIPPESKIVLKKSEHASDGSSFIIFHHLDGLYSYCTTEKGGIIHLAAITPLKKVKDHYEFNAPHKRSNKGKPKGLPKKV